MQDGVFIHSELLTGASTASRSARRSSATRRNYLGCEQLRELWTAFKQMAPPGEEFTRAPQITEWSYDDWMSTGCTAGQPLPRPASGTAPP